ncbi:lytic transglycosylase [Candidatus Micrarchaeota archaeon]|nr:lytic transglycosylase [Candidatus Micrarchaeota archaeon]
MKLFKQKKEKFSLLNKKKLGEIIFPGFTNEQRSDLLESLEQQDFSSKHFERLRKISLLVKDTPLSEPTYYSLFTILSKPNLNLSHLESFERFCRYTTGHYDLEQREELFGTFMDLFSASSSPLKNLNDIIRTAKEKIRERVDPDLALRTNFIKIFDLLEKHPESASIELTKVHSKNYREKDKNAIRFALGRALGKNYNIKDAVKGFREVIEERNKKLRKRFSKQEKEQLMKLVFLAIPESVWDYRISGGYAVGPYQFTWATAEGYGLIKGKEDFRGDIYISAKAAASHLIDNLIEQKRDMGLAIARYNSGMPIKYRRNTLKNKKKPTYNGYLNYLRDEARKIIRGPKDVIVVVKRGDNLTKILNDAGIKPTYGKEGSIEKVKNRNKMRTSQLRIGQRITIPKELLSTKEEPEILDSRKAGYIRENINYPPKYYAVLDILKSDYHEFIDFAFGRINYDTLVKEAKKKGITPTEVEIPYILKDFVKHVVGKGENLRNILKKHGFLASRRNLRAVIALNRSSFVITKNVLLKRGATLYLYTGLRKPKKISKASVPKKKPIKHKVKRGQTLTFILNKHGIPVKFLNEIKKFNRLRSANDIKVGQVITIPRYPKKRKQKK